MSCSSASPTSSAPCCALPIRRRDARGEVVAHETARLEHELGERGLRIAATLLTGADAAPAPLIAVPHQRALRGCDALRAWGTPERVQHANDASNAVADVAHTSTDAGDDAPSAAAWLAQLPVRLLLFPGKGGVGKSTCASACAVALSHTRRVLLFSTDPAGSLADVFACAVTADGVQINENLRARQIDAAAAFDVMRAEYQRDVSAVFESIGLNRALDLDRRVLESLWESAPPGVDEIVALLEILDAAEAGETLVVDTAPTGHFLRLIEMPGVALDWAHAIMRILVKYHAVGSLDAAARGVLGFARRLKDLQARLLDPQSTAAFVVTLDEPVVIAETERLIRTLRAASVPLAAILWNRADAGPPHVDQVIRPCPAGDAAGPAHCIVAPSSAEPLIGVAPLRRFVGEWKLLA